MSSPPPAETSADVASSCFDRTGSVQAVLHMQVLWQRQLRKGCSRQQGGPSASGETRYSCEIWSRGTDYSAVDSPGGPLSRGDYPQHDRPTRPRMAPGLALHVNWWTNEGGRTDLPFSIAKECQYAEMLFVSHMYSMMQFP